MEKPVCINPMGHDGQDYEQFNSNSGYEFDTAFAIFQC